MPVHKLIHSSAPSSLPVAVPGESTGGASVQLSCTCPMSEGALMDDDKDNNISSDNDNDATLPPRKRSKRHSQLQYPRQHLSTCALHGKSHALQKELAQLNAYMKQKHLKFQQEQEKRKRDPFSPCRALPTKTFHLYAGSRFQGKQRSGSHSYDVMVDIKHVDLNESFLCGYLHIKGLTTEYPELTTYFEAEMIGPKYSFLTRKWDANENIDKEHWKLFKPFKDLKSSVFCGSDDDDDEDEDEDDDDDDHDFCMHHRHYDPRTYDHRNESVVFMRWKEHFLVPDHRVQGISGASFAGFYYICYNKATGSISGYYYHQSSERHQQLLLAHMPNRSFGSYEFR